MLIRDANDATLRSAEEKLRGMAQELKRQLDKRLTKTKLQQATLDVFGKINENCNIPEGIEQLIELLQNVINALPSNQSGQFQVQQCYSGFLAWNKYWKECFSLDKKAKPDMSELSNVHIYYENWIKSLTGSQDHKEFQKLWEIVMIRSSSEAMCETVGSIMNQACGKNRHLLPHFFNMEIMMNFNLGPMHCLDSVINQVLASDKSKTYIRGTLLEGRLKTKDVNKSSAIETFEETEEKKSRFPASFWLTKEQAKEPPKEI